MKEQFDGLVDHLIERGFFLEEAIEILERTFIERTLARTKGKRSAASKALGIHRNTLQRKMIEYQLGKSRVRRKPLRAERGERRKASAG